jgi:hypothetical protein
MTDHLNSLEVKSPVELGTKMVHLAAVSNIDSAARVMNGSCGCGFIRRARLNDEITQLYPSGNLTKTDLSNLCKPD